MLRARKTVYWPGMEKSLQAITDTCPQCREHAKSHTKEPMIPALIPDYPMMLQVISLNTKGTSILYMPVV